MTTMMPNERMIIFGLGLALLILGSLAFVNETSNRPSASSGEADRMAMIASGTYQPGLSTASNLALLFDCRAAMTSLTGRAQPTAIRDAVSRACLDGALQITAQSPTFSAAWLTAAVASVQLRDWPAFAHNIEKSYATGANEQWVAQLRVDLVSDHRDRLDADLMAAHRADLRLLLSHDSGRQFLVERYVALTAFREEIDAVLPDLSESASRRFLNLAERREIQKQRQIDAQLG